MWGDLGLVIQNDAGGIGLFRSEFLYLDAQSFPSEEEQFAVYKRVAETMAGKKVIIRTLDIGADKQVPYFGLKKEENPALGYRAIRICLSRQDMFKVQLRAILRASAYGSVSIMFPMIISVREVRDAKELLEQCKTELRQQGDPHGRGGGGHHGGNPRRGHDRRRAGPGGGVLLHRHQRPDTIHPGHRPAESKLDPFYDPHHPAVLRMIRRTVEADTGTAAGWASAASWAPT